LKGEMAVSEEQSQALLAQGGQRLGIELTRRHLEQFEAYCSLLGQWNQRSNLTAVDDYQGVQLTHFLDSLTVLHALPSRTPPLGQRVIDIGAGAGFPGLPLKIVYPGIALVLVESAGKKTAFLQAVVATLHLSGVEVVTSRAEELAQQPAYREQFGLALARAVAELPVAVELALPFCKLGGLFVAQKKGDFRQEMEDAQYGIELLGGRLREVVPMKIEGMLSERALVVIEKVAATPARYPRRPGIPGKRPLLRSADTAGAVKATAPVP
jgi:16S rRNA (guanine527-N7)-methyltransferase